LNIYKYAIVKVSIFAAFIIALCKLYFELWTQDANS